ncbi:MAG TPA: molecular chaperone TorD family protein [Thermodesulfovibrionales bacterium]|nr:molecular chaperone TorD family protein [Thermodesulfovibrionales bacterium]
MKYFDDSGSERAAFYRLFASLFMQEPSEETLLSIKALLTMEFNDTAEEIGADFRQLFLDETGHLQPYESLYNYPLGEEPRLWGKATEEVQRLYRTADLMIDEETNLLPDHLSLELLFMSYLAERGLSEDQKAFLGDHLLTWVPVFCDEVMKHCRTTFYREAAALLKEYLSSDYEGLEGK